MVALATSGLRAQDELTVVSVKPARHALTASRNARVTVEFDRPLARETVTEASFWAFGRWSGAVAGEFVFSDDDRTVALVPQRRFSSGETVMVILSRDLRAADGTRLRAAGYSYQFWTRARRTGFRLTEATRLTTRSSPAASSRAYGGVGSDLDGDGFLDLTIVNEDTNDLRTFLNRGDGTLSPTFLTPTTPVGNVPSPSEPSDFDRDGNVDLVVANTQGGSITILLGAGDGTFASTQTRNTGGEPRGVTVLDADGDGDIDIAVTSFAAGRVEVYFNDGSGRFGARRTFGTGSGERAIAAGDMNDDGILDLVVATLIAQQVHVYTGNGDGTFTLSDTQESGGDTWMLVLGDVDRDGAEDVAVVNSGSDNAAILLNDGAGRLGPPAIVVTDPFPLATDLADLDGDGDLDWVTSSFFGDWLLFDNNGAGVFSLRDSFAAPQAASCSIPMDIDRDGALDLVLIDELSDDLIVMMNGGGNGAASFASGFETGDTSDWTRARGAVEVVSPGLRGSDHALEVTVDGTSKRSFVETRLVGQTASLVASFELHANQVELAGGTVHILRLHKHGSPRASLLLGKDANGYYVWLLTRHPVIGFRTVGTARIPGNRAVSLEVEWSAASAPGASDGRTALSKNGRIRALLDDVDNFGMTINKVSLGVPIGSEQAADGTFLVDDVSLSQ